MCYINSRLTYLLTYLESSDGLVVIIQLATSVEQYKFLLDNAATTAAVGMGL